MPRFCVELSCGKTALYNIIGSKAMYCSIHKSELMINVSKKRCIENLCDTRPTYNLPNEKEGIYCNEHKKDDMVGVSHKKCLGNLCHRRSTYNFPNEKGGVYCNEHKKDNMVNINSKMCIEENCEKHPTYNFTNEKTRLYCNAHKKDNMIDIKNKKCTSCGLFHVNKTTNFLCSYCNPIKTKRIKSRENEVRELLEKNGINAINDKIVRNECCLKYRPDFLIETPRYFLIIECDEDAHKQYSEDCEIIRMNNISHSLGLPTKFIRYNPDNKIYKKEVKEKKLIETIKAILEDKYYENFEAEYLFY